MVTDLMGEMRLGLGKRTGKLVNKMVILRKPVEQLSRYVPWAVVSS